MVMDYFFQIQKLCQIAFSKRRWIFVVGVVACTHLLFQSLLLPYGNAIRSLFHVFKVPTIEESTFLATHSSVKSAVTRNPLTIHASDLSKTSVFAGVLNNDDDSDEGEESRHYLEGKSREIEKDFVLEEKHPKIILEFSGDRNQVAYDIDKSSVKVEDTKSQESFILEKDGETRHNFNLTVTPNHEISVDNLVHEHLTQEDSGSADTALESSVFQSQSGILMVNISYPEILVSNQSSLVSDSPKIELVTSKNNSTMLGSGGKKMKSDIPPKLVMTIDDMNRILKQHRASSRSQRPRRSSAREQEILAAKTQIANAPSALNDQELYSPLFRNVSMFKRSYELMERILKVYVYKEGNKPIFHSPILKGLYASEGWFMKLMEGNKHYVVKDPRRAHLFYMPFSTRMLEYTLYVRNSHNKTNLRQYLKEYTEKIAAKYSFFNRTGGADHFLVACHDWAPYETRHHMEHCIKALCNADVTAGFKIGRDVSLPETYVRSARNPLRDLGGKPPLQRHILAFYAGNMHGYLRQILLKYWEDKDPEMMILGPMPAGVASKMTYIQHMKSSKYCICPKGYEVNSPRVVESLFYECVPVIISDNFVLPFFEVLNWDAFSVIIPEKDIPNLKSILLSIPEEKYLQMQLGVRKAQQHFLWQAKPLKYDLFHMILHSIWYNRVFQIKPR